MQIEKLNKNSNKYNLIFNNVVLKIGDKFILQDESFNISYSNIFVLKGKIGSGKSSILKTIAGIYKLEKGEILNYKENKENCNAIYVHSQPELNFLTGYVKDELKLLGIKDYTPFEQYLNKSVDALSGGSLKKISILMALNISNNRVVLLDEPLDMLDDMESESLSKIIIEYSKQTPFIIATHDKHFDNVADVIMTL